MSGFNRIALTLLEARVTLYPADAAGAPVLSQPLWLGAEAEELTLSGTWLTAETRPTGVAYPRRHNLIPLHEIQLGRVWALPLDQLAGFQGEHTTYVLDLVWQEAESGQWHRRTYYGVTLLTEAFASRSMDSGFSENQSFAAQYFTVATGTGAVPVLSAQAPYLVWYVSATEQVALYAYAADTGVFTALEATAARGTVGYAGDAFEVTLDGVGVVLATTADGLHHPAVIEQTPLPAERPRMDFTYAGQRVCSVSAAGLWARSFDDVTAPVSGAGRFELRHATDRVATLGLPGVVALSFTDT